jgi:hypothetical protein
MVGQKIGGVNVFGGGLALYGKAKTIVGAESAATLCADYFIAWRVRNALGLITYWVSAASRVMQRVLTISFLTSPSTVRWHRKQRWWGGSPHLHQYRQPGTLPVVIQ